MSRAIAIIPARGGSKGLPGKNLKLVGGTPLISRAIRIASAAKRVDNVFVSTDDDEIASTASSEGAYVIARPEDLSGDSASSESALLHALDYLEERNQTLPEAFAFIQCTSPFGTARDVDAALDRVLIEGHDSVFTAAPFHYFVWRLDNEGRPSGVNHSGLRERRQDREPEYLEAGSVYAMRTETFRRERNRFCGRKRSLIIVEAERVFEIDDARDLARAQALAPLLD